MSMNVLSLDEKRVVMQSKEQPLADLLEKYGFKIIEVDMSNAYNIGGALNCWTLDIRRRGELKTYFDKF